MICLEDLIGFRDLTLDEVHAIAEHEHIADAIAAVLGASILHSTHGPEHIRDMFIDGIRAHSARKRTEMTDATAATLLITSEVERRLADESVAAPPTGDATPSRSSAEICSNAETAMRVPMFGRSGTQPK